MPRATTRLAPTPSGFLHEGNAVNFLLVSWLARQGDADVVLRIDDHDAPRYRPEYVDDAFEVLAWLGIEWDRGPRTRVDLESAYSQRLRTGYYREQLDQAARSGLPIFACRCTRRESASAGAGGCLGECHAAGHPHVPGVTALRMHTTTGDVVLWRRDGLPAYHLVSVIEDRDLGVNLVIRGEDLHDSSTLQRELAPFLNAHEFAAARFVHHELLLDSEGRKLAKSSHRRGPMARDDARRAHLVSIASGIAETLGIVPRQ